MYINFIIYIIGLYIGDHGGSVLVAISASNQLLFQFLHNIKPPHQKMSTTRSQILSRALTVLSANIEGLSVVKASMQGTVLSLSVSPRNINRCKMQVVQWAESNSLTLIHDAKLPKSFNSARRKKVYNPDLIFQH